MTKAKNKPRKAMILAAGFGTRMRPLTLDRPKPLMPFWGKPILQHAIDLLASFGVKEIVINCHYEAAQIMDYVRTHPTNGVSISLSFEPEILGTGGALKKAAWFFGKEPFWLYNADVISLPSAKPLLDLINKPKTIAVVWQQPERGPRSVDVSGGKITNFISKTPGAENTSTFTGLQLIKPALLDFLPNSDFSSIITAYTSAMKKGFAVRTVEKDWFWNDLGKPEQYLEAHVEVAAKKKLHKLADASVLIRHAALIKRGQATGFVSADPSSCIHPSTKLQNAVIWEGVSLGAKAKLKDVIVAGPQKINHATRLVSVPASLCLSKAETKAASKAKLKKSSSIEVFSARGSDRSYFRLHDNQRSAILMRYEMNRAENGLFAEHTAFLNRRNVPVAKILHHDKQEQFILLEDLGNISLLSIAENASRRKLARVYSQAVQLTARFHLNASKPPKTLTLQAPFDKTLYDWERGYFARYFLTQVLGWNKKQAALLDDELRSVSSKLLKAPEVMVHRDLQSTNIMFSKNKAYLIDFQGMRLGAASYDLASLILDPYVMLPLELQKTLLSEYVEITGDKITEQLFWYAGVQRLMQALGAYGRLSQLSGTVRFKRYIQPGLLMLHRALAEIEGMEKVSARLPRAI